MKKALLFFAIALLLTVPFAYASENRFFAFYGGLFNKFLGLTGLASGSGGCNYNGVCDASETVSSCPNDCCDTDNDNWNMILCGGGTPYDCNDNNPNIHPYALELCNGIDDDCDGLTDEGGVCGIRQCMDNDGDTYSAYDLTYCRAGDDCDDNDGSINPGASESLSAPGICSDGKDNDCDGQTDSADTGCQTTPQPPPQPLCRDADGDAYPADRDNNCQSSRSQIDCNDNNAAINPGAEEICGNGINDNCLGGPGDREDLDGDGFSICQSNPSLIDCNDNNPTINPIATEIRGNGIDEDCSGADAPATVVPNSRVDLDGDGVKLSVGDCDDTNPMVHPGAREKCENGIDDDCDGNIDMGGAGSLFPGLGPATGEGDIDCTECLDGDCSHVEREYGICPSDCPDQTTGQLEETFPQMSSEAMLTLDQVEQIQESLRGALSFVDKLEKLLQWYYSQTSDPKVHAIIQLISGLKEVITRFQSDLDNDVDSVKNAEDKIKSINFALGGASSAIEGLFPQQEG